MTEQDDLLNRIRDMLKLRGPLLLPRFGGTRRISWIFRWEDAFVLLSDHREICVLSPWQIPLLCLSLGMLSPHSPQRGVK